MEKLKELLKNKKVVIATVVLLVLIGIFGYRKYQEKINEERLASAIELLETVDDEKTFNFQTVEGRTDLIINILTMEDMSKDEMANDIKYVPYYDTVWYGIIEVDTELNDKINDTLIKNGYSDIKSISYIIDENDEIVAIIYDDVVYYDYLEEIDKHEKLENEFNIEIELEELE